MNTETMKEKRTIRTVRLYFGAVLFLLALYCLARPTVMRAQTQICSSTEGYNAVYGTCPSTHQLEVVGSPAFLDASAWCNGNCNQADICKMIGDAMATLPSPAGGVVDARGVVYPNGGGITCSVNPFQSSSTPVTVLLPPGSIDIQATWVLPSNTRIVGQNTSLVATPTFTPDPNNPVPAMLEMGNASVCPSSGCTGISMEHLTLNGNKLIVDNVGLTGIYNGYAKDGSYLDDVGLYEIAAISATQSSLTTGLLIDSGAAGSGPYSNITFFGVRSALCTDNNSPPSCNGKPITCVPTAAVQIRAATRGLHGITTTALSTQCTAPAAAIYLDASNNTIEDVHDEGFYDAVVVGDNADGLNATVAGNVILNVTGDYGGNSGPTTNAVHICNPQHSAGPPSACSTGTASVSDVSLLEIQSIGSNTSNGFVATTIKDDLTSTTINPSPFSSYAAMYFLGEPVGSSQYSRFTTTPGGTNGSTAIVPTWGVGSTDVTGISCSTFGALYSNIAGGNGQNPNTLFLCSANTGNWVAIK
jgi:hypothetical protein